MEAFLSFIERIKYESQDRPIDLVNLIMIWQQEQGDIKGGILADEMGMGKTIQAISLIVTHCGENFRPKITPSKSVENENESNNPPKLGLCLRSMNANAAHQPSSSSGVNETGHQHSG